MREGARGVKRLLNAIYQNADDQTIKALAYHLHYAERQLREDIADIPEVTVENRDQDE